MIGSVTKASIQQYTREACSIQLTGVTKGQAFWLSSTQAEQIIFTKPKTTVVLHGRSTYNVVMKIIQPIQPVQPEKLIPVLDAVKSVLGDHISKDSVYAWIQQGRIPIVPVGRKYFVRESYVKDLSQRGIQ